MTTLAPHPVATRLDGLWSRWVLANTWSEAVGLSASALVFVGTVVVLGEEPGGLLAVVAALAVVASGAFEGGVVGFAQGRVLRRWLPAVPLRSWVLATMAGAVVAWTLGMLPSMLMAAGSGMDGGAAVGTSGGGAGGGGAGGGGTGGAEAAGMAELSTGVQLLLAAAMGAVLGPVLGVPQWRVLRRHVPRAGWWVGANSLAWAAAMPVVFLVAGGVPEGIGPIGVAALVVLCCAATGGVAGAVHGWVLVRLLRAGCAGDSTPMERDPPPIRPELPAVVDDAP
jgi:hypothetical protein